MKKQGGQGHSDKTTECDICHKVVAARGIGAHKRLQHGITEKVIIRTVVADALITADKYIHPEEQTKDIAKKPATIQICRTLKEGGELKTGIIEKRPSDHVSKNQTIIAQERIPIHKDSFEKIRAWIADYDQMIKDAKRQLENGLYTNPNSIERHKSFLKGLEEHRQTYIYNHKDEIDIVDGEVVPKAT